MAKRSKNHTTQAFFISFVMGLISLFLLGCATKSQVTTVNGAKASPLPSFTFTASATTTPTLTPTHTPTKTPNPTATPVLEPFEVGILGQGLMSSIYRSPDNKIIVMGEGDETLRLIDAETYQELGAIPLGGGILRVHFSADSQLAAVEGWFGATVIDIETLEVVSTISTGSQGGVSGLVFTPDNHYVVFHNNDYDTGGPYHSIGVWDLVEDQNWGDDPYSEAGGHFATLLPRRYHVLTYPAVSPDGKLVAAGHSDQRVYVWDLVSGETQFLLEGHADSLTSVAFSPDGRYLASASRDGTVRLWNPKTGKLVRVITGFLNDTFFVEFAADSQSLIVGVREHGYWEWDLTTEQFVVFEEPEATPDPFALAMYKKGYSEGRYSSDEVLFSPDGNSFALANKHILVWDLATQALENVLENQTGGTIRGMAYSPDSQHLAAATTSGQIIVWDVNTAIPVMTVAVQSVFGPGPGIGAGVFSRQGVAFSPNGKQLAFGSGSAIEVWDVARNARVLTLEQEAQPALATSVDFSADGERLYVIANRNKIAQIWDLTTGELVQQLELTPVDPNAFTTIDQQGALFARNNYAADRYWIEIWNLETEEFIKIDTPSRDTEPIVFSPDGELLSAVSDGNLYFWKTATGECVHITSERFGLAGIAISPATNMLAVGRDGQAVLADLTAIHQIAQSPVITPASPPPTATPYYADNSWPTATPYPTIVVTPLALPTLQSNSRVITLQTAAQITEISQFGKGTIEGIQWRPDGQAILVTGSQGVYQYEAATFNEIEHAGLEGWVFSTAYLPDGRLIAAGEKDKHMRVWDAKTKEQLADLVGYGEIAVSPDGKLLVFLDENADLETWDIETGQALTKLQSYARFLEKPVFSPDSHLVAAIQSRGSVRVWDSKTGEIVSALGGPINEVTDLSFSADGQYLVGAADGSAWIWDLQPGLPPYTITLYTGKIDGNLTIFEEEVTAAALSSDNRIVAVGTSEKEIWLYDRRTRNVIQHLEGHSSDIVELDFSPDDTRLVSADANGQLLVWHVASGQILSTSHDHLGEINGLIFRGDGNLAAWESNTSWVISPANGQSFQASTIYSGTILAASPVADHLVVYNPYRLSLWDATTGELQMVLDGEAPDVFIDYWDEGVVFRGFNDATFVANGQRLWAADTGGNWLFDTSTGDTIQHFTSYNVDSIASSPDNQWLLVCHYTSRGGGWLEMLNARTGATSYNFWGRGCGPHQFAFSPDNRWIGTLINLWEEPSQFVLVDPSTGKDGMSLPFEIDASLTSLAFSPTGQFAAIGQSDGQIYVVDLVSYQVITTLEGHRGSVDQLAFSQNGFYLASGSADGTLKIWGLVK